MGTTSVINQKATATRPAATAFTRLRAGLPGAMLAEFFGTFVLMLLGLGAGALNVVGLPSSGRQTVAFGPANWLILVFGWAFAVMLAVYLAGGISGAHLNPAITLAFAIARKFGWRNVVPYCLAQLVGAFSAAAVVYTVYLSAIDEFNAANHLTRPDSLDTFSIFATYPASYFHGGYLGPFVDQLVGTAILAALIAALIDHRNQAPAGNMAPLTIGFVIAVIMCSYGTNAGAALNPARDLGPRLFAYLAGWGKLALSGNYGQTTQYWWIPIVGPLVGAVIGIGLYDFFIGHVLGARATMLLTPEPGLAPLPTTDAASGVAGPVTAEESAEGRDRAA
ncbi:MIP/aquaporin family protein [Candidatus Mycobacterium methanotrophicum]|uniref:MIP family channel protein n=1 Tax=Candidatus Mycobacterium methanotrophicum TaxID=2943498 RepID=A0ABY4QM30_9MYCO|nr:MIP family channel protein [Candidatus Mycobacterium methanotrophicum]UQX10848.1 MIP family channel protein [Candidatus Mycobacterium methanotrophicum]